jgi:hypothetical protein
MDRLWKKLADPFVRRRLLVERLAEPLHMNALSALVSLFGSTRAKIDFDLILRPQHAASILRAADVARGLGLPGLTVLEFGVASGAGLSNMCQVAGLVSAETGIDIQIAGFDTGSGMPPAVDYRDHPELYREGDYPMVDREALVRSLPANARLLVGNLDETIPAFLETVSEQHPIGFISVDVDYYSSTRQVLQIAAAGKPTKLLPTTFVYLDDVTKPEHNRWCGELLAVDEFNAAHALRKIEPFSSLRSFRIFQRALWLNQMYILHVLDHPVRHRVERGESARSVLSNPYLAS